MDIGEQIVESLEEFAEQLRSGERIMVTTLERCGCDPEYPESLGQATKCHICGGKGFIRHAKTWLGGEL